MRVVGITGGIACGKSTITHYLRTLGAQVIDADAISRELTAEHGKALPALRETFGLSYFDDQGRLDRRRLGATIFADPLERAKLNAILHPLVQEVAQNAIEEMRLQGQTIVFFDVPLLYETGLERLCDRVWVVHVPRQTQIARLIQRDKITGEEAQARIDSQMSLQSKVDLCDVAIENDADIAALQATILQRYKAEISFAGVP